MKSLTSLYVLWGVICCLNVCFIVHDARQVLGYAIESVYPNDLQELSVDLVTKPDIYAPDTLVNLRTGEAIEVAYGQAYQRFWHTDSFQTVPWWMRLAGTLCGMASFCLILWPFRWTQVFFRNIEQGDFFTTGNARLLRRFGCYQLAGVGFLALFRFIEFLGLRMQLDFEYYQVGFDWFPLLAYAIAPSCALFAAEAFRIGARLQKDTEGLV